MNAEKIIATSELIASLLKKRNPLFDTSDNPSTLFGFPVIRSEILPEGVKWMMLDKFNTPVAMEKDGKIYTKKETK